MHPHSDLHRAVLHAVQPGQPLARGDHLQPHLRHAAHVVFGLRPEHLAWTGADVDATSVVEVAASVVEPLGADTLVFFEISGLEMVARVPPEAARDTGDCVRLRPDLRRMHLFDPATGARI